MTKKTNITEAAAALGKLGGKKIPSHAKDAPTGQRENPRTLFRCAGRIRPLANPRRSRAQGADDTPARPVGRDFLNLPRVARHNENLCPRRND